MSEPAPTGNVCGITMNQVCMMASPPAGSDSRRARYGELGERIAAYAAVSAMPVGCGDAFVFVL